MLDDQTLFELDLRRKVHSTLWKAAVEEARTHGTEAQAKRMSLIAHHGDNGLWEFVLIRSSALACEAVAKLRGEILDHLTPDGADADG